VTGRRRCAGILVDKQVRGGAGGAAVVDMGDDRVAGRARPGEVVVGRAKHVRDQRGDDRRAAEQIAAAQTLCRCGSELEMARRAGTAHGASQGLVRFP
jgi:hypothetical protein